MFSSNSTGGHYIGKIIVYAMTAHLSWKVCTFVPIALLHLMDKSK